ncbi:MAG: phosphoribosylaminoimidazolesuccinocarboxamide synthase [Candidatus Marinamargulisbacteria bacterium]
MIKIDVHTQFDFGNLPLFRRGKVRDVFDFGHELLIVSSDRVSAFDQVIDRGIPNKGRILTEISQFWFNKLDVNHHCLSTDVADFPEETRPYHDVMAGRSMLVKKTELIPIECVVRGYIIGSGWKDYQKTGAICGHRLPSGLELAQKLDKPIFTPAAKSFDGHDENISLDQMADQIGTEMTEKLSQLSVALYETACKHASDRGIIIADTKFEFGLLDGDIIIIDEALTPDSSRFWAESSYKVGVSPRSFDKQIVRDYVASTDWDGVSPMPQLPDHIVEKTAAEYATIQRLLTT